jgi:hypothetical protein
MVNMSQQLFNCTSLLFFPLCTSEITNVHWSHHTQTISSILLWFTDVPTVTLNKCMWHKLFHMSYFSLYHHETAPKLCRVTYRLATHYLEWLARARSWNLWRNIDKLSATTALRSHSRIEVSPNSDRGRNPNFLCACFPGTETKNLPV